MILPKNYFIMITTYAGWCTLIAINHLASIRGILTAVLMTHFASTSFSSSNIAHYLLSLCRFATLALIGQITPITSITATHSNRSSLTKFKPMAKSEYNTYTQVYMETSVPWCATGPRIVKPIEKSI